MKKTAYNRKRVGLVVLGFIAFFAALIELVGVKVFNNFLIVATFVGAATFCLVYLRRPWRTPVGYNIMAFGAVVAFETGLGILTLLFGTTWEGRDWVRAMTWILVGGVMWWRVALVVGAGLRSDEIIMPLEYCHRCPHCLAHHGTAPGVDSPPTVAGT